MLGEKLGICYYESPNPDDEISTEIPVLNGRDSVGYGKDEVKVKRKYGEDCAYNGLNGSGIPNYCEVKGIPTGNGECETCKIYKVNK